MCQWETGVIGRKQCICGIGGTLHGPCVRRSKLVSSLEMILTVSCL